MPEPLPLHPTILIGYGSYGRKVLRRLLTDAEGHGLLVWEDPPGAGAPSERRLKDLVLIHIPDHLEGEEIEGYIAKDLFRQIHSATLDEAEFKQTVVAAKKRLLDEASRNTDSTKLRLGLDLIVVAQPASTEALGTLERLLPPALQEIASDVGLRQTGQGAARASFILTFDFENYWNQSPFGRSIRRETGNSIRRWEKRMQEGLPSFGRIYMLDGHTEGGNRDEPLRIEELTLFLEFLLFTGLRDHPSLRSLYQQENDLVPPVGTFGMRLIERSQALLKRLVAAYFGLGWLAYMSGSEARSEAKVQLQAGLQEFQPANLDLPELHTELAQRLATGISAMEGELALLPVDGENWPAQFREQLALSTLRLKSALANWAGDRAQQMIETRLKDMPKKLQEAVTHALHHESAPAPLGNVIYELKELQRGLQTAFIVSAPPAKDIAKDGDSLDPINTIHRDYHAFKRSQVNPSRLADWWVLLALVMAVAWTPIILAAVEELPVPGPNALPLFSAGYQVLVWMAKPIIIAPLVGLAAWLLGKHVFQRHIRARIERGLLTFVHPDRGWVISRIRRVLQAGSFRASLESYAEHVFDNMLRRLRGIVLREVNRILERLESRRKEMEWLRNEMRTFLNAYGFDPDKPIETWEALRSRRPGYHSSLEEAEDFQRMMKINPPTLERFESTQTRLKPFTGWEQRYSHAFLYPVVFLERLSQEYEDAEKTPVRLRSEQLAGSFARFSSFSCAMRWEAGVGPGVDVVESYCVMPDAWKTLAGTESLLSSEGMTKQRVIAGSDPSRTYLLRYQLRVSSERLQDSKET